MGWLQRNRSAARGPKRAAPRHGPPVAGRRTGQHHGGSAEPPCRIEPQPRTDTASVPLLAAWMADAVPFPSPAGRGRLGVSRRRAERRGHGYRPGAGDAAAGDELAVAVDDQGSPGSSAIAGSRGGGWVARRGASRASRSIRGGRGLPPRRMDSIRP
jgi:hypothetical protein